MSLIGELTGLFALLSLSVCLRLIRSEIFFHKRVVAVFVPLKQKKTMKKSNKEIFRELTCCLESRA